MMQLFNSQSDTILQPSVATIGFFDGVHCGHRFLIEQVCEVATARGLCSAVITFPIHPRKVMQSDYRPELLTTCDEKVALLAETSLDTCIMLEFTRELARCSAREFMALLKDTYQVHVLVIGYDHRFGHNRSEGFDDYVRYGQELGIEVILARAYTSPAMETVSSSAIRRFLADGKMEAATACLGYEFFLEGTVVGGHRVGREIGFPTANIRVSDPDKLIPMEGVYAVRVHLGEQVYKGMLSIGYRSTFNNGTDRSIEVHILHFHSDIYNKDIRVSFVCRTRPEYKYCRIEDLIARLQQDAQEVEAILAAVE